MAHGSQQDRLNSQKPVPNIYIYICI
jgi:hypothetical protein